MQRAQSAKHHRKQVNISSIKVGIVYEVIFEHIKFELEVEVYRIQGLIRFHITLCVICSEHLLAFNCLRPSSQGERNRSVPSSFQFLERKIGCPHGNRTTAYQFCFVFGREHNRSVKFSICLFRRERNGATAYCSTFRITSLVLPIFRTVLFEVFPPERNPPIVPLFGKIWNEVERLPSHVNRA